MLKALGLESFDRRDTKQLFVQRRAQVAERTLRRAAAVANDPAETLDQHSDHRDEQAGGQRQSPLQVEHHGYGADEDGAFADESLENVAHEPREGPRI